MCIGTNRFVRLTGCTKSVTVYVIAGKWVHGTSQRVSCHEILISLVHFTPSLLLLTSVFLLNNCFIIKRLFFLIFAYQEISTQWSLWGWFFKLQFFSLRNCPPYYFSFYTLCNIILSVRTNFFIILAFLHSFCRICFGK